MMSTTADVTRHHRSVCVSIVSHGHGSMILPLIRQLLAFNEVAEVIVTHNVPEDVDIPEDARIRRVFNQAPRGFGENHNRAFSLSDELYFCVLNPDVRLPLNPYPRLLAELEKAEAGLVAPKIVTSTGKVEDSVRTFPTLMRLLLKGLKVDDGKHRGLRSVSAFSPECVAGMFMLFTQQAFAHVKGFDQRYFLYYEDIDICVRLWKAGLRIRAVPSISVVHDAQRDSHRSLRFLTWHTASMLKFLFRHMGRLPKIT